jgi:hypothetical protein
MSQRYWQLAPLLHCVTQPPPLGRVIPDAPLTSSVPQSILRQMAKYQTSRMDRTFSALADPTRRGVLLRLRAKPGLSVSEPN